MPTPPGITATRKILSGRHGVQRPVSYTHLDVYKRQRIDYERCRQSNYKCGYNADYVYVPFDTELRETVLCRRFDRMPFVPEDRADRYRRCRFILEMQAAALAKRLRHTNAKTAVVGVSGGLDSTLALIVIVHCLLYTSRCV